MSIETLDKIIKAQPDRKDMAEMLENPSDCVERCDEMAIDGCLDYSCGSCNFASLALPMFVVRQAD